MNIFVLTAGRTGSKTFARACSHATNVTSMRVVIWWNNTILTAYVQIVNTCDVEALLSAARRALSSAALVLSTASYDSKTSVGGRLGCGCGENVGNGALGCGCGENVGNGALVASVFFAERAAEGRRPRT